jgi:ubiquinone/menaquinone biosynthesis C-methylase UbiE
MTSDPGTGPHSTVGRTFNSLVTGFWTLAAPLYDQPALQRWVYRPAQDEVIDALRAHGSRRIADVACGTGILAARIADELHPDQIFGVDLSDGMLQQAGARSSVVDWRKGPAEQLPFEDDSLDAVVSTTAFHFFDQSAALREFCRVITPAGLVAVATVSPPDIPGLSRLSSGILDGLANPVHSPAPREMRRLFTDAGLEVVDQHRVRRPFWTTFVGDLITIGSKP